MAGHPQSTNIINRRGRQNAAKSKLFGKLAREITVSAKLGVPDPAMNPRLRAAMMAARAENMPKDNIERAIKKALGGDAETYEQIRYEGYGPGGVAVIVEVLTDNRNRGAGEVVSNETTHEIYAAQDHFGSVAKALDAKFGEPRKASLTWRPHNTVAVDDEQGEKVLKLIENLNDNDDVQNVYANFEISDALVSRMSA